ncbi:MAG: 1-deoxy-D-xylulose-5-phosphate synthase, partial [Eggerthellaceae bacterium]|nr:1-deoxy-D-xylulose-5-phosphate synthase [Eggerthellaceae bacterium]
MADASRILDRISGPADLHALSEEELGRLAAEIREEIIRVTSANGGHVASSLGAVEIILAVHSLIDSPTDKFIFDVGHQAYAHKLVTGREDAFATLRKLGGLSGFPKPDESPHDVHPSGHASDSLSVALGMAKARDLRGGTEKIVTLIGDASIAGGMAFEALSHIGSAQTPMLIILNDNEMSIGRSVGALARH